MNKTKYMSTERVFSLPIRPFLETHREWVASMSEEADPEISFSLGPVKRTEENGAITWSREEPLRPSAFEVFESFLAIREARQALDFFQSFGPWEVNAPYPQGTGASSIHFSTLERQRKMYEDALLTREPWSVTQPNDTEEMVTLLWDFYLWGNLPMELVTSAPIKPESKYAAFGIVRCMDVKEALRAAVFLDRLDGLTWRRCARTECGKLFQRTDKRRKLYCSEDCAHLQSSNAYNWRKRGRGIIAKTSAYAISARKA